MLVGPLAERIVNAAPGLLLEFLPSGTLKIPDLLDRSELDLAIGPHSALGERFSSRVLLRDEFVTVLYKNYPMAKQRGLSMKEFAKLPHLEISSARQSTGFVDQALAQSKLARRIGLHAPFLSAARVLVASDMLAVLPARIAKELARNAPLIIRALPFSSPVIETTMTWPRWFDNHPAHAWLRNVIFAASTELHGD